MTRRSANPPRGERAPGRGIWVAWSLALLGGLAVLAAVALALLDVCLQDGRTLVTGGCAASRTPTLVVVLTGSGTLLAVVGGLAAAVMSVRGQDR